MNCYEKHSLCAASAEFNWSRSARCSVKGDVHYNWNINQSRKSWFFFISLWFSSCRSILLRSHFAVEAFNTRKRAELTPIRAADRPIRSQILPFFDLFAMTKENKKNQQQSEKTKSLTKKRASLKTVRLLCRESARQKINWQKNNNRPADTRDSLDYELSRLFSPFSTRSHFTSSFNARVIANN